MAKIYMYVMSRDFGFAPNPFNGVCTLATCKPVIRGVAEIGDWVVGLGGGRLKATDRCIFAMRVDEAKTFDEYWFDPDHRCKRPVRIGTSKTMVGDNIYHHDPDGGAWVQADSHHSRPDGTTDTANLATDTGADRVLLSRQFIYFGREAIPIPPAVLQAIGYHQVRSHRTIGGERNGPLLAWLASEMKGRTNMIVADPFDFEKSSARYSAEQNRIVVS